jgi:hypothetical protein
MAAFANGMHPALLASVAICPAAAAVSLVHGCELRRIP